jgi:ribosomal protein S18 acetylase RimI-like enzyme
LLDQPKSCQEAIADLESRPSEMHRSRIRRANVNDAPAIAQAHVSVSREIYAGRLPDRVLGSFTIDLRTKQWHEVIAGSEIDRGDAVYVAEIDELGIVGFGHCSPQRDPELTAKGFGGEFQSLYLIASARGHGLGRALMSEMARHLLRLNFSGASCSVLSENHLARKFYEALNGELIGEKTIKHGDAARKELAYGWSDLNVLTRHDDSRNPLGE